MNEQEREVISDIFKRLEQAAQQPRDPEAERFIASKIAAQPYAPYAMAQAVFVQEQALNNLNAQVQELQAEVEYLRRQPQGGGGGFLSSLFGGGARQEPRYEQPRQGGFGGPAQGGPVQGGPWGQPQGGPGYGGHQMGMQPGHGMQQPGMMQPGMMPQRGGSGFLGTAMMTAAGVAGGMMLGSALSNAFGGAGQTGGLGATGADAGAGNQDFSSMSPFGESSSAEPASFDDSADFGGDAGGDDWA